MRDLWAYLRTLPPSNRANQAHDLRFPFGWRLLVTVWKWLFFTPGAFAPDTKLSPTVNRGAYLVQALGHCGECHTPRNFLGGPKRDRFLAGGKGPDDKNIPNLTPTKLKKLSDAELKDFLLTGLTPDGDVVAESMGEVITQYDEQADRRRPGRGASPTCARCRRFPTNRADFVQAHLRHAGSGETQHHRWWSDASLC